MKIEFTGVTLLLLLLCGCTSNDSNPQNSDSQKQVDTIAKKQSGGGDKTSKLSDVATNEVVAELEEELNMNFQTIPAGKFMMGSPKDEIERQDDENGSDGKQVEVEISKPFDMMTTEVTQMQWYLVMGNNPSHYNRSIYCANHISKEEMNGEELCPTHPVELVSWNDVQEFIKKLNNFFGLKNCHGRPQDGKGCYRLPTEAEWEYATRGGTTTAYFYGDAPSKWHWMHPERYAWYRQNSWRDYLKKHTTYYVRHKNPNPYGLYDVYGNLSEWVQDEYKDRLIGGRDPLVNKGTGSRVIRGGNWSSRALFLRSASRARMSGPGVWWIGFRLVRTR